MAHPTATPASFAGAVSARLMLAHDVRLSDFPATGELSARISLSDPGSASVKVRRIVVHEVQTVTFTPDDPPPPGEPPLPPQTEQTLTKVREGDGSAPLLVEAGNFATVEVIIQELSPAAAKALGTLVVSSDAWESVSVPLAYTHDTDLSTTFSPSDFAGHQGGVATAEVVAQHLSGPEVELRYEFFSPELSRHVQMDSVTLRVRPGETQRAPLKMKIGDNCPVGQHVVRIDRTGGSQFDNDKRVKLEVKLAPVIPQPTLADAKTAVIREWNRLGGAKSPLGLPVKNEVEVAKTASGFESRFRSGVMALNPTLAILPTKETDVVTIDLVGIECQIRQEGTDEIYGVVTVIGPANNTIAQTRFGPLEMGPRGTRIVSLEKTLITKQVVENYKIHVALIEHDSGDVDVIAKKVADKVREGAAAAIGALTGVPAEAVAESESFSEGIDQGLVFLFDDILGIGDDALLPQALDLPWPTIVPGAVVVKLDPVSRPGEPQKLERWTHQLVVSGVDHAEDLGQYGVYFRVRAERQTLTSPTF
jgi:hypothetical protein